MSGELVMPKLGLTMTEGILSEWKVRPGESYKHGQVLFVVETEKIANEVEAHADGTLISYLVDAGETVPVGTAVAEVSQSGDDPGSRSGAKSQNSGAAPSAKSPRIRKDDDPKPENGRSPDNSRPDKTGPDKTGPDKSGRVIATPLARRLAREFGIPIASVDGSGPRGRIKAADVEVFRETIDEKPSVSFTASGITRYKPSPVQGVMASRLSQVKHGTPHFYLSTEADVSRLLKLRSELNEAEPDPKLTLTHFLVAAIGDALQKFPNINRTWDDGEIVQFSSSNVCVAVDTENGLFVPVVRDVEKIGLGAIARATNDVIGRARSGSLAPGDMESSAITLSNAGMHDVTWLTPIINLGQSSIIGTGSVREVFRPGPDGEPLLMREMGIVFSGDHRVHTGVEGLKFLNRLKFLLENPLALMCRN